MPLNPSELISILLPVRNAAAYLAECLSSIIRQSDPNWELLVVNDHSTDQSNTILQQWAAREPRIKVLQNEGRGIIKALRLAFAQSQGQLITRMDADDLMPPHKLQRLRAALQQAGPGHLSTGWVRYFSEGTLGDGYLRYQNWLNDLMGSGRSYEEIYRECVVPSPCWMVYRQDLLRCQAFDPNIYPEDYDLCFRFYQQQLRIQSVPEVLHLWRNHPERASRNDPHYADQRFFELKLHYFQKLEYHPERPLLLWGAGKKGKLMARLLQKAKMPFHWLTNNEKKIGQQIYGLPLLPQAQLPSFQNPLIIVCVAGPEEQKEIRLTLEKLQLYPGRHYFFFC
ncbi:MAG: glycosyltransferase [Bacteroidota bacterium]